MAESRGRKQYLFVIGQLTGRELKRKYARSYLGIFWSVLNPLLSMAVLSLIFSRMFRRSIENYPIYYLTGFLIWQTFTGATNGAMTALVDNKALLMKVKVPMEIFLLSRVYTSFINLGYSFLAYLIMLFVFRLRLSWTMLLTPLILGGLFLFSLGMAQILAVAYVFFGDMKHLYSVMLTLWMYCSAIFYPVEQLEGVIRIVVLNNPLFAMIDGARKVMMYGTFPSLLQWAQILIWSAGLYFAGVFVFRKNRNLLMQKI